ncbi:MAG: hypothetical protein OEL89_02590 [Candidatus Peregrinibacteria bacterium]|nr:hypothetical protein [Candidatus Peregrinibacteria bacterium]
MNFKEFYDKLEQMNQNDENQRLFSSIVSEYITNDISFNFTHDNVNLNHHLTKKQIDEIAERYYSDEEVE